MLRIAVNSVPRFENAWMQRSKFPYTARSSAKVIRHAVSIDERRAKFRQDLMSESKSAHPVSDKHSHNRRGREPYATNTRNKNQVDRFRQNSHVRRRRSQSKKTNAGKEQNCWDLRKGTKATLGVPDREIGANLSTTSEEALSEIDQHSVHSTASSFLPAQVPDEDDDLDADEAAKQDIQELWFPGCHADLGGGWPLDKVKGEEAPLSHGPLVWMVREAQRAGLDFDSEKMLVLKCCDDSFNDDSVVRAGPLMPEIQVTSSVFNSPRSEKAEPGWAPGLEPEPPRKSTFHQTLENAFTKGVLHDCLEFNNGLTVPSVLSWKIMEYLPFRRMDLQADGSWKAISIPLPMGETRDIPENAWVHNSAIKRMEADEGYRPGNLIIGGGGRGVRKAPKEMGMGQWEILKEDGDPVGMTYVRKGESVRHKIDGEEKR